MRMNILAPHILRLYTWNLLMNNTALTTIAGRDGTQLIPIAPVNDEPDLRDSGSSYIIYGFAEQEPDMSVLHRGTMSYRIVARTFADLSEIMAVISSGFEIEDMTASNINLWSSQYGGGIFIGTRFTSCCVTYSEAADAQEQEGGPIEGLINIRYNYVVDKPVKTFQPNGTWA
jgi:hypothetical protein